MRYGARVEYDGTDFCGFQRQPGLRTVQGVLEDVLGRLSGSDRVAIRAAGRTDAGVHATGQLVAFDYAGRLSAPELSRALDALLPRDVAVHGLRRVARDFSPRARALRREYRYTIWNGPRHPLIERYALGVRQALDVTAMAEAAALLVGRRDFSAYGGRHARPTRTVHACRVRRSGRLVTIDVVGDAFLRQMVRSIVAALLLVGRGESTKEDLLTAMTSPSRAFAGVVAPAKGLCLRRVVLGRPAPTSDRGT